MGRPILAHKMIDKAGITHASQHNAHTVPHSIDAVRCYLSRIGSRRGDVAISSDEHDCMKESVGCAKTPIWDLDSSLAICTILYYMRDGSDGGQNMAEAGCCPRL